jgi:hypothetical protein
MEIELPTPCVVRDCRALDIVAETCIVLVLIVVLVVIFVDALAVVSGLGPRAGVAEAAGGGGVSDRVE